MRLLVRPNKDGAMNIGTTEVFLTTSAQQAKLFTLVEGHLGVVRVDGEPLGPPFHAFLRSLLSALTFMNKCWRSKDGFQWQQFTIAVDLCALAFQALGWKPVVWLHWV